MVPSGAVSVAVRVTIWLTAAGFGEAVSVVVVLTGVLQSRGPPCRSQAEGIGSVLASVFVPSAEKVGFSQLAMNALAEVGRLAPGILVNCAYPASTRLIGSGA